MVRSAYFVSTHLNPFLFVKRPSESRDWTNAVRVSEFDFVIIREDRITKRNDSMGSILSWYFLDFPFTLSKTTEVLQAFRRLAGALEERRLTVVGSWK